MGYVSTAKKTTIPSGRWSDFWKQQDYWAVWLGLAIVLLTIVFSSIGNNFMNDSGAETL